MDKDKASNLPTQEAPSTLSDAIAIVGMGCLLPKAHNPQQFWQNLIEEIDSTSLITENEIGVDPDALYDPVKGTRDRYYWKRGGYVRDFVFDPTGYKLPPEQLDGLDNVFKWSLYVSRQALEDSGYLNDEAALAKCGLILGNLTFPIKASDRLVVPLYQHALEQSIGELLEAPDFHLERLAQLPHAPADTPGLRAAEGNLLIGGYPAGIVAQALALQGGHFAMDAACATSLYAIKLACYYLKLGQADMMLAGAVSGADPYYLHMGFSIFQAYPEEGMNSRPLDSSSRGLRCAEGAGMFVLKRYQDALRDGDKIYALIRGGGLSNDGQGKHTLTPNPKGQKLAFERAYANAALSPEHIDYVECHATGTPLGDVTELNSMESFFGPYGKMPLVGSVKSNFGHLLTAAAMASMMKAILGMNEGIIPATINVENPLSSQEGMITGEQIVRRATPWPSEQMPRLVGVTAFGFGGTNAHLILESHSSEAAHASAASASSSSLTTPSANLPLAIVGMDAFFGPCEGLEAFYQTLYEGRQHFVPLPETRWKGMEVYQDLLAEYGLTDGPPLGAYIEEFEMDFLYFKSPPSPVDQPTPQHLLMLKVADQAINDAGLQKGSNVAVLIAMGAELASHQYRGRVDLTWQMKRALEASGITLSDTEEAELEKIAKDAVHSHAKVNQYTSFIGNVIATRISALWDFVGPSFTVSVEENSFWKALDIAQILLATNEVEAVVVGAVDLSGGIENVLLRHRIIEHHTQTGINSGTPTLSYDEGVNGWMVGEGAGAVVLKPQQQALADGDRVYAVIESMTTASPKIDSSDLPAATQRSLLYDAISADTITQAAQRALEKANISDVSQIGYLEVYGSGIKNEDQAEIEGLLRAYGHASREANDGQENELPIALGSVKANIGHTYCASGIASLIKTALCLHHRFIPTTPNWSAPQDLSQWAGSPFYVPTSSRPWFKPASDGQNGAQESKRIAAISGFGVDGMAAHLILSDDQANPATESQYQQVDRAYLFPLSGNNQAQLEAQLDGLEQLIKEHTTLSEVANQVIPRFDPQMGYTLSICGQAHELLREIERARKGVTQAFAKGKDWQTPRGSCFTINPLGQAEDGTGTVAFVYPGAFNSYIGLGQDLYRLSPWLHEHLGQSTSNLARSTGETSIYPRSMSQLSKEQLKERQEALIEDALTTMESGLAFSVASTQILRREFGVQPDAAFGYSLGEASMMWGLNLWTDGDLASDASRESELFRSRLSGPKSAVADFWSAESGEGVEAPVAWHTYVLMSPAEKVQPIVDEEAQVYLTIINSPKEVVIAGDPEACQRVIKKVGGHSLRAPFDHVLHCPPMRSEYDEFRRLHDLPINPTLLNVDDSLPAEMRLPTLYSASAYAPISLSASEADATAATGELGHHVAQVSCEQLDFPRLVNQVYNHGARIFIEMGASRTCTRWVGAILKGQPHLAIAIDKKGVDNHTSILRVLAKLVAHKVPVDLSPLYDAQPSSETKKRSLIRPVITGGVRLHETIVSQEHKKRFAAAQKAAQSQADYVALDRSDAFSRSEQAKTSEVVTTTAPKTAKTTQVVTTTAPKTAKTAKTTQVVTTTAPKTAKTAKTTQVVTTTAPKTAKTAKTTQVVTPTSPSISTLTKETMDTVQPMSLGGEPREQPTPPDSASDMTQSSSLSASQPTLSTTHLVLGSGWSQWQQLQMELLTELQNSARLSKGHRGFLSNRQKASQQMSNLIKWQIALLGQSLRTSSVPSAQSREEISHVSPAQLPLNEPSNTNEVQVSVTSQSTAQTPLTRSQEQVSEPPVLAREPVAQPVTPLAKGTPAQAVVEAKKPSLSPPAVAMPVKSSPAPTRRLPEMPALGAASQVKPALHPFALPHPPNKPVKSAAVAEQKPIKQTQVVIWDEADMLEFAQGKIANVFGPEYAEIDRYHRRVRLPTPPYLLVSRVTKLSATRGKFEPCSITTEYDIPTDAWYLVDGQTPWAVAVESGQCDLLLISYLGIDFECKGERVYRLLDATLTFLDTIPMAGDTLRYDISINGYARSGPNLLFFFSYDCYIGERMVLKMRNGCAGFFSDNELAEGQGVIFSDSEKAEFERVQPQHFEPLLRSAKTSFTYEELVMASEGKMAACFGPAYDQGALNPSLRLSPPTMLMMDRILSIDVHGGRWGLGSMVAEKDLAPDDWYFPCHFMDDQVLAGSLMADGCVQLMQFFLLYIGLQTQTVDARFHPLQNVPQSVRCRGQVTPINRKMTYELEVTEIGLGPEPYAKANVSMMVDGMFSVFFKDLGLCLIEKEENDLFKLPATPSTAVEPVLPATPSSAPSSLKPALFNETDIEEFAKGSIVACFGPEYNIYADRRTPRTPNGPLKLVSRILEIQGQRHHIKPKDYLVSEYDVPADAWFYEENNYPTMPYSIIMEIALQPCGFLSAYLGSTLPYPEIDFYFRNLDGHATLSKVIDLRGKTITNKIVLLSSTAIQGIIIQKFDYQLFCDDELFYEGFASFGYFTKHALTNQIGLDNGKAVDPWYKQAQPDQMIEIDLNAPASEALYQSQPDKPHYRLAHNKLNLLDSVLIAPDSGLHQKGYIYAERAVEPSNWFYFAHFYQDPVMPGSLGVEAILQAMQVYALQLDLGNQFDSPHFDVVQNFVKWKYRGEIYHDHLTMRLEIHITEIENTPERVTIYGDASLWRNELRMYEVKQIALNILESK